ncbi:MAG: AMP-binding protein [Burkholderiaceae bacterium]
MNIAILLANTARRVPHAPAVSVHLPATVQADDPSAVRWTYDEFARRAAGTASWLLAQPGVEPGERVALAMNNEPGFLQLLFGCWFAGLCAVPMNARLHAREFAALLADADARLCLASCEQYDALRALDEDGRAAGRGVLGACGLRHADAALLDEQAAMPPAPLADVDADEPAWLFYTSGTTGRSKGAMLSHRNLMFMTHAYYADIDQLDTDDTIVHAAPLSHGSGLYALPHVGRGSHNLIIDHFSCDAMFEAIAQHPNVSFFAAPTMLVRLVNDDRSASDPRSLLTNLKTVIYGGAPMYVTDLRRALDCFGPRLYQLYGQGESPMTIAGLDKRHHAALLAGGSEALASERAEALLGSCGYPRTGVQVRIVDEAGEPLPPGEIGEVATRSDARMLGYWRDPAASEAALRDGWLLTGDLGCVDEDGLLTLKDRSKDLVISGGSNIYPREVEDVLLEHQDVAEAGVLGVPHPDWGEELVAVVVARRAGLDADALDQWCLDRIARFKRPKRYLFVDELPKNAYGKVLKTELKQRVAAMPEQSS